LPAKEKETDGDLPSLLIVDDDEQIRQQMKWSLCSDYKIVLAEDRRSALALFQRERPRIVTLDMGLPPHPRDPTEGLLTLSEILQTDFRAKVIVVSGNADRRTPLQAIEKGAYDFFTKPVDMHGLRIILRRAHQLYHLEEEHRALKRQWTPFGEVSGTSPAMQEVYATLRKVAPADIPVFITGESGTGKERLARSVHEQSLRGSGPFVAIHCGAIPASLLESELFGNEKGAFTGADAQRKGRIECAEGGTLFLDEMGTASPEFQVKLLRFLQEGTIERVGGRKSFYVDARVVAATNADLKKAIEAGTFREDLFFRLNGVSITLPPLRARGRDVLFLAQTFLASYAEQTGKPIRGFSQEAIAAINHYSWPGNVRELENKVRGGIALSDGKWLTPADLDIPVSPMEESALPTLKEARSQFEKQWVEDTISRSDGNIPHAAKQLGISNRALHDLIVGHQIVVG
jgi:two-component system NtrC family response regulator